MTSSITPSTASEEVRPQGRIRATTDTRVRIAFMVLLALALAYWLWFGLNIVGKIPKTLMCGLALVLIFLIVFSSKGIPIIDR